MNKIVRAAMLFLVMLIFFCGAPQSITDSERASMSSYSSKSSTIKFKYFYRGFATIKENMVASYPNGTLVIQTDKDWHDFMDKYVPGIPYYLSVDYSKECLVFDSVFPARPIYAIATDIKTLRINESKIVAEYTNGETGIANGIYAQDIDGVEHCFVNIVKINKKAVPRNIKNIYRKK